MPNDGGPPQRVSLRERLARLIAGGPEPEVVGGHNEPAATPSAIRLRLKEFETSSVRDVMTSRVDIAAVEITATMAEVLGIFAAESHSRMPVFRESLDEPLGFIHIKDVVAEGVRCNWSAELLASRRIEKLVRDIMYVPESILLPDLLIQMQSSRIHIAIVVDEYGGTGGMVCLEDLVEGIVGEIEDEHDEARPIIIRRGRSTWEVDGLATVEDVERETGLPLHLDEFESDVDTIGGLVAALGGRVLQAGESVEHPRGPTIEVVTADPRRVIRLRLRAAKPASPALAEDKTAAIDR
ncbi:MAG TPA: hemolysin family protein [Hyphomonadaceae bacterium]|nr:hemolysin family protein [Hyphomonadaceae bacterium]HPI47515.1 hemolysin family protein [Hyphomonadaceae bacterium]